MRLAPASPLPTTTSSPSRFDSQRATTLRILRVLGIGVVAYLATGLLASVLKPRRVIAAGEPWCFDDWCLAVQHVGRAAAASDVTYAVDLRLFSRARRVSQRAKGAWIYLIDRCTLRSGQPDYLTAAVKPTLSPVFRMAAPTTMPEAVIATG